METVTPSRIAGIRFQELGKLYHFEAGGIPDLKVGDQVLVSTSRGRELGEVAGFVEKPPAPPDGAWKAVERRATAQELVERRLWQRRELEAMIECRAKASELGMRHVKIAEIEFRQVGPRDVAKILGGMGACGLEERCCSKFLTEFSPISIKMAKAQGISLNPQEITGMCGRLRCCLVYEYEQYVEARKTMPKRNKRVITPAGEGRVAEVLALKQTVIVALDDGQRAEFYLHELQPYDELKALQAKAMAPCGRHEAGQCTCGKDRGTDEEE